MLFDIIIPDIDRDDDQVKCVILVMEFQELDLQSTLKSSHKMDFDENTAIMILYNLLLSVNFLHKCNLMHRDIKPANILLDCNCVTKLCDFGLARTLLRPDTL